MSKRKVRTATFNKVNFDLDMTGPINGTCDYPRGSKPTILIAAVPGSQDELMAIIHETLHASDWSKSEEKVTRIAHEQARLLWRLGYRRPIK